MPMEKRKVRFKYKIRKCSSRFILDMYNLRVKTATAATTTILGGVYQKYTEKCLISKTSERCCSDTYHISSSFSRHRITKIYRNSLFFSLLKIIMYVKKIWAIMSRNERHLDLIYLKLSTVILYILRVLCASIIKFYINRNRNHHALISITISSYLLWLIFIMNGMVNTYCTSEKWNGKLLVFRSRRTWSLLWSRRNLSNLRKISLDTFDFFCFFGLTV